MKSGFLICISSKIVGAMSARVGTPSVSGLVEFPSTLNLIALSVTIIGTRLVVCDVCLLPVV